MDSLIPRPRRRAPRLLLCAMLVALLMGLWIAGLVGKALTRWIGPTLLPLRLDDGLEISALHYGPPPPCPATGVRIIVTPERAIRLLNAALPDSRWLPPGVLHNGMVLRARILSRQANWPLQQDVECVVAIAETPDGPPRLDLRLPAASLNTILRRDLRDALVTRDDYLLGEFRIVYKPEFTEARIRSLAPAASRPVTQRRLMFDALGNMRIRFEDSLAKITTDGRVTNLEGHVDLKLQYGPRGVTLWYDVDVIDLTLDVKNAQRWIDRETSGNLERALEKLLDKEKTKRELAAHPLPDWIPFDLTLDARLTPSE